MQACFRPENRNGGFVLMAEVFGFWLAREGCALDSAARAGGGRMHALMSVGPRAAPRGPGAGQAQGMPRKSLVAEKNSCLFLEFHSEMTEGDEAPNRLPPGAGAGGRGHDQGRGRHWGASRSLPTCDSRIL